MWIGKRRIMANIGFISLGCAKNQVDCERMMYRVQEAGFTVQADVVGADVVVINTCGFIDSAKAEAIDSILQMAQLKEQGLIGKILVTGCLSQRYQREIVKEMPEVDGILGTGSYTEVVPAIEKLLQGETVEEFASIDTPEQECGRILTTPEHYAYIKIAEGCDNRCGYCIIPYLRGKYRSRQMDDVLYEARLLAANGVKELLVVAQDTSRYGTDFPEHKRLLPELLRQLCRIDGIEWIRVHYTYPDEIDDALIDVMATEPKIVKYLDIPIQHCNSKILKLMNRRGDSEFLRDLFTKLRSRIPGLILRTSVITGLPGEGEAEFEELCEFLKEQKLERVGAFPFSPEEGTPAAEMECVDSEIAQKRAQQIELIQSRIMDAYNASMQGKTVTVLVDGYDEEMEQFYGRTYADSPEIDSRVWIASQDALMEGTFIKVCIDGVADGELSGFVLED
ncbi:MAG: 30S ribosomal protein S12 methylthiotransferase RimO [Oscillospiraceae bacterium]|nr:30S ribosomal protein S12 methylthiotransferase RimO [Oscillospiraceae bacterium]